jgi:CRP/FNR family cyclic AMP-dependent transcriptional regulator
MFEAIDNYIARCITLTDDQLEHVHKYLHPMSLKRKAFLLHEGEVCQYEAYIVKGCLRKYCISEEGDEINLQFGIEDWWMSDLTSFTEQKPSQLNIQALEDSELLVVRYAEKERMFKEVPETERLFRLMVQRSLTALQERFIGVAASTAEQRYLYFLEHYPNFLQRIPQHHIASFLGMSPEFLSKVRTRLAHKS